MAASAGPATPPWVEDPLVVRAACRTSANCCGRHVAGLVDVVVHGARAGRRRSGAPGARRAAAAASMRGATWDSIGAGVGHPRGSCRRCARRRPAAAGAPSAATQHGDLGRGAAAGGRAFDAEVLAVERRPPRLAAAGPSTCDVLLGVARRGRRRSMPCIVLDHRLVRRPDAEREPRPAHGRRRRPRPGWPAALGWHV